MPDVITPQSIATTAYQILGYQQQGTLINVPKLNAHPGSQGGKHKFIQTGALSAHAQKFVHPVFSNLTSIKFLNPTPGQPNAAFLPFLENHITSVVLPANPRKADPKYPIEYFFTDPLSGCAIYIDRAANGDLVVYHANAMAKTTVGETRQFEKTNPARYEQTMDFKVFAATSEMRRSHREALAQNKFQVVGLTNVARLERSTYYRRALELERERSKIFRTKVDFQGGVNVFGIHDGARGWSFYWQCYGRFAFTDPKGKEASIGAKVIDHGQFYGA